MKINNERHILTVENADLSDSTFRDVNLSGSTFVDAGLEKARFTDVNLTGAKFHNINFTGVEVSDGNLADMKIDGIPVQAAIDAYRRVASAAKPGLDAISSKGAALEIRSFRASDEEAVTALWHSVFRYSAPHNDPALVIRQKLAVDPDMLFVAVQDGTVIGTAMGGYDGHRGWIYSVAVDNKYRQQGAGTALVRSVEQALAARGCVKVNLQLLASNAATIAFYKKLGYEVEDRISAGKVLK